MTRLVAQLAAPSVMVLAVLGLLSLLNEPMPSAADRAAQAVAASRAADQAQCRTDHGPAAIAVELPDGSHRCRPGQGQP